MTDTIPETEHIFIRGEGGTVFKMDLPLHETIEARLSKGYLTRVNNAEGDPYVEEADAPAVSAPPTKRPALSAAKPAWVGWAVVQGMTPDDAEALTTKDLIEKFGTDPAPADKPADAPSTEGTPEGSTDGTPEGSEETPGTPAE
jgi:hypothetical protein